MPSPCELTNANWLSVMKRSVRWSSNAMPRILGFGASMVAPQFIEVKKAAVADT